jgi:hypothetical protein
LSRETWWKITIEESILLIVTSCIKSCDKD